MKKHLLRSLCLFFCLFVGACCLLLGVLLLADRSGALAGMRSALELLPVADFLLPGILFVATGAAQLLAAVFLFIDLRGQGPVLLFAAALLLVFSILLLIFAQSNGFTLGFLLFAAAEAASALGYIWVRRRITASQTACDDEAS